MGNSAYTPTQVMQRIIQAGEKRVLLPVWRCVLLGMLAGGFIAFGAATSSVAAHHISDVGTARVTAGTIFPVGLMMIILIGGELFTGDCLMVTGIWNKKYRVTEMIRVLAIVWISNLVGAVIVTALVSNSGIYAYSDGGLGAYLIKTAYGKCGIEPIRAFCSGILCNILVCAAVLMSNAARNVIGKIAAIFFPIMAFVVGGWEHCVANMFYIPAGIMAAANSEYVAKASEWYGLSARQIANRVNFGGFFSNIIPVTLGNIVGAMLFVALPLYLIHKDDITSEK